MSLKPVNGFIQIEPIENKSLFMPEGTNDEIGIVIAVPETSKGVVYIVQPGYKVYFDSWQASKYPTGEDDKFYWLVPSESVKAYEIPEIRM